MLKCYTDSQSLLDVKWTTGGTVGGGTMILFGSAALHCFGHLTVD